MSLFICPVCNNNLTLKNNIYQCENDHCYDLSKYGYVNLLLSQKSSMKRHGDDKLMISSRSDFLNKGYYNILLETLTAVAKEYIRENMKILDAGCGECFYTANLYESIKKQYENIQMCGIDISKDALKKGSKRNKEIELAVASIFHIPVASSSCDMVLNIFAPNSSQEFDRILKTNGILLRVIPLEKHLFGLKQKIYDKPYLNKLESFELEGLSLLETAEIKDKLYLSSSNDIEALFQMTPYYYKTSEKDQLKVKELQSLETEIEFLILLYQKR